MHGQLQIERHGAQETRTLERRVSRGGAGASAAAAVSCLALVLWAQGAYAESVVTGLVGEVSRGDEALEIHDPIAPDSDVELGPDGRCAVLLASNAILQLCDEALVRLRSDDYGDRAVVELDRGSLKATVESGGEAQRVEIHTPAAVATVLGTILHVEVDPDTGDTTISSLESRVRVQAAAPDGGEPTGPGIVIEAGEQVVVPAGGRPGTVHQFDPSVLRSSQRCLDDEPFRASAVRAARLRDRLETVDEIAQSDIPTAVDRIDVASAPVAVSNARDPIRARPDLPSFDLCFLEPTTCVTAPLPPPPLCGVVPGDQCRIP